MAKKTSTIIGVTFAFRRGKGHDAYRAYVYKDGVHHTVSAKVHPTLKAINNYLSTGGLRKETASRDPQFLTLSQRLEQELSSEYGLKNYRALERVQMKTKEFDFAVSLDRFQKWKDRTSVSYSYRRTMEFFWLPFFVSEKNCIHPSEFKEYQAEAEMHVRTHRTKTGEPISIHSFNSFFKVLNQYVEFCVKTKVMGESQSFKMWYMPTKEEMKRGQLKRKRSTDTYERDEIAEIKKKIDRTYANDPSKKLKAYGFLIGVMTGLRQGNVLGLKAEDLFPDHDIPHYRVSDNIVSGYSRGSKTAVTFINSTKTTTQEDGEIILPFLQPDPKTAVEVARYLKQNYHPCDRICPSSPGGFYRAWERIAKECGFKFLNPHNWKHSYATIGAENLEALYRGDPRLLQLCCLHESFRMTEKYIKKKYPKSLRAWTKGS